MLTHIDHGVSGNRDERDLLVGRVNAHEDDGVRAEVRLVCAPLLRAFLILINAKEEHVEGVVRLGGGNKLVEEARVDALGELAVDVVDIPSKGCTRRGKNGDKRNHHDLERAMAALCLPALGDVVANAVRAGCGMVHLVKLATTQVGRMGLALCATDMCVRARLYVATLHEWGAVELVRVRAGCVPAAARAVALYGEAVLLLR